MSKKIVKITETELVALIDNIVTEAVAEKKTEWIAENASKNGDTILESRIADLEAKITSLSESKK